MRHHDRATASINEPLGFNHRPPAPAIVACEGWVLKKRRKKMQGFARRYFVLYNTGILEYSFEPGLPVRDQISLQHAAITTAPGRKDIHIDSNTATFHIKCLSTEDFKTWMSVFRNFISLGNGARRSLSSRISAPKANVALSMSEDLTPLIEQLEESILALLQELPVKKPSNTSTRLEKDRHKDNPRDAVINFFKKHSQYRAEEPATEISPVDLPPSAQRTLKLLGRLKDQYASLLLSLQSRVANESVGAYPSPLPSMTEESGLQGSGQLEHSSDHYGRCSMATTISDGTQEWHDAVDIMDEGPEEFLIDAQSSPDQRDSTRPISTNESQGSLEQLLHSDDEISPEGDTDGHTSQIDQDSKYDAREIVRRHQLPSRVVGDEGSLFSVLKKNVGKDLSTITLPVTFNEPLTLLGRLAEEFEYHNLLDEASGTSDPVDRLAYIAAFAVSGYAHTRHRTGRKGFNPMLAETFEDIRMKFIAEKVRHHPVELACHAEGNGWELTATSAGQTKFWGKSLEIIPRGVTRLRIGDDHFSWTKPSSFIRNLVVGTKYLEHCGDLIVEDHTHKYRCVLEFKQSGYWGPSNVVSGCIYSPEGDIVGRLEGKWDDQLSQNLDSSHFRLLWRMNPFPKDSQSYYGFTEFAITLNEITSDLVGNLPRTDSRFRPDVQALERGEVDVAETVKHEVEQMQRERRKQGRDRLPRWFHQVGNEWVYTGGYWEARARGWKDEDIKPLW